MPVREALRRLQANNFITIHKRKISVNELSHENVNEILKMRLLLECYTAKKATLMLSSDSIRKLEKLLKKMESTKDINIYLKANKEFHYTIYKEAQLPIMLSYINSLWERYSPYLHILPDNSINWYEEMFVKAHRKIFEAIKVKDPEAVSKWLEADLKEAAERILSLLDEQQNNG
jgi:DNA-binding GntR family transcriptional regulator